MGTTRELDEWQSFVYDVIKRSRRQAWGRSARNRHTYKGIDRGIDEATTRQFDLKLAQTEPMKARALHTIIADGVWTPQRAYKRQTNSNGKCLLCGADNAGVNHIWWECPALNKHSNLGYLNLNKRIQTENNKPS
eukprot:14744727-Heterocapsa_arctica.AAC.1